MVLRLPAQHANKRTGDLSVAPLACFAGWFVLNLVAGDRIAPAPPGLQTGVQAVYTVRRTGMCLVLLNEVDTAAGASGRTGVVSAEGARRNRARSALAAARMRGPALVVD